MARILSNAFNISITSLGFTAPYTLPASGKKLTLKKTSDGTYNTIDQVRGPGGFTLANGWWTNPIGSHMYYGYSGLTFAPEYGAAGAMVIAGSGSHGVSQAIGGFLLDMATGLFVARANANGLTERDAGYPGNTTDGAIPSATVGAAPAASHLYNSCFCPPLSLTGNVPTFIKPWLAAADFTNGTVGADRSRAFKFNMLTGRWDYASDNMAENVAGGKPSAYTEKHMAWDGVSQRAYSTQIASGYLQYLKPVATSAGWTWTAIACPGMTGTTIVNAMFVDETRRLLIFDSFDFYNPSTTPDRKWYAVDITSDATISQGGAHLLTVVGDASLTRASWNFRWHKYTDGAYYSYNGSAPTQSSYDPNTNASYPTVKATRQYLMKLTPPGTSGWAGNWTLSQVPIADADVGGTGITAVWQSEWGDKPAPQFNAFLYVPAIQCFVWIPRNDAPAELIKP